MRGRIISNMKRIIMMLYLIVFLTGCLGGRFEYVGEYPELYSVVMSSILGARGYEFGGLRGIQPTVYRLDEDSYERMLFMYVEGEAFASAVIIQKIEEGYVYFYPHYNFLLTTHDDGGAITSEETEVLREINSWDQPISDDSVFVRVRISRHRESGPISNSRLVGAHNQIFPDSTATRNQVVANTFFLRTDSYGRSVYAKETGEWEADGSWSATLVAFLFQPDYSFDLEVGVLEVTNHVRYQTELREFMEANGWDTPFEE